MKAKPIQAVLSSHSEGHRGKHCYTGSAPSEAPGLRARQGRGAARRAPQTGQERGAASAHLLLRVRAPWPSLPYQDLTERDTCNLVPPSDRARRCPDPSSFILLHI